MLAGIGTGWGKGAEPRTDLESESGTFGAVLNETLLGKIPLELLVSIGTAVVVFLRVVVSAVSRAGHCEEGRRGGKVLVVSSVESAILAIVGATLATCTYSSGGIFQILSARGPVAIREWVTSRVLQFHSLVVLAAAKEAESERHCYNRDDWCAG
jgi:hypothetical protein